MTALTPVEAYERGIRRRVGITWGLLFLNVLTFYPGYPLAVPIPHVVGQALAQGALPLAVLLALTVNRRVIVRPNVFLCVVGLLVIEAVMTSMQSRHLGTVYRTVRLGEFVAALWLLSPWWGRRDLLLARCHLASLSVVLGSVLGGLMARPGAALSGGRLTGVLWPIPPTQVAHYAAVTTGLVALLWLGGVLRGPVSLLIVTVTGTMLLLTHTRTALVAMLAGILVAGMSLFAAKARVRRFFAAAGMALSAGIITTAGAVTTWLARGESPKELANLTGRTTVWQMVLAFPRNRFQVIFGSGLANKGFNGLPIDSNWLASYNEQGLFGVVVCAALLLFLLVTAYFQQRGVQRALAIFLATYCLLASFTETGFTDASVYLLELTLAASLLVPLANEQKIAVRRLCDYAIMRFSHRRDDAPRRRAIKWAVPTCFVAGVTGMAGLAWVALTLLDPPNPISKAAVPASPPVRICGNSQILGSGPESPPKGAVIIPAGNDDGTAIAHNWTVKPHMTYWFARGTHTLGPGQFAQIQPADGDTFIGAPGAILDGRGHNHYAFTGTASNVTIEYLTIQDFGVGSSKSTPSGDNGGQGVVNHDSGHGWVMKYLTVQYSAGAGVFLGTDNTLSYSCLRNNGEYGFQGVGKGPGLFSAINLTIDHNEISGNNTWNWESKDGGCGCSGADKFWNVADVRLTDNYIHDNHGPGIWADTDNANFDIEGNYVSDNDSEAVIYETSYNLRLTNNTFARNALVIGPRLGGFPASAVYISESGGDRRVPHSYGDVIDIARNTFTDNWGGVVLWENANRYCGSGANTSTGYCTLVDHSVATVSNCRNSHLIDTEPYYKDCRWKTKNVLVRDNHFNFDPKKMGPSCSSENYCGFNGIFSQWGSWLPYHGNAVENHITFEQNNHFYSNSYDGPWRFVARDQSNVVSWAAWRGSPYNQDAGSTMNGRGA